MIPDAARPSAAHARSTPLLIRDDIDVTALEAGAWNALAGAQPLLSHAFLAALHESGCASPATGWRPQYLTAWHGHELAGAMPLYGKSHSYGEYVFDWAWADAYRRHRRRYYPKLVCAIPFTPVTGDRLLAHDAATRRALLDRALGTMDERGYSSLHVLFTDAADTAACAAAGMIARDGVQFHWSNRGYATFGDYLAAFNHDKRKKIRQERRRLAEAGMSFERLSGAAIGARDWDHFYRCYSNTYAQHGSTPYLSREFFARLAATMPANLLMVIGRRHGERVCAAFDVHSATTLWGRYWGALDYVPGMHFEACYYQAIEFCIETKIAVFEGGAQGIHKLARGLTPVITHSSHAIGDADFAEAIAEFCARERVDVAHTEGELERASPFRQV
ncbi:MAG: GNAT family N-acetyltransferase [Betaproteobacteria bacterium]